ncbi:MAG: cell division protein ZapA [Bacteroidales bacterium]|nr:cell division protein ZapA [Bacteroidales bacterium]MBR5862647.1 cell division protein ZapA [Bacteroidales bacterium]
MAQSINVIIADRPYPVQVKSPEHEEMIRKAAADINKKVRFYLEKFPTKGMVEVMTLVALNLGILNCGLQMQVDSAIEDEATLLKELEAYLEKADK